MALHDVMRWGHIRRIRPLMPCVHQYTVMEWGHIRQTPGVCTDSHNGGVAAWCETGRAGAAGDMLEPMPAS